MKITINDKHIQAAKRLAVGLAVIIGGCLFLYYGFAIKVMWWPVNPAKGPMPIIMWALFIFSLSVIIALLLWAIIAGAWKIGKEIIG